MKQESIVFRQGRFKSQIKIYSPSDVVRVLVSTYGKSNPAINAAVGFLGKYEKLLFENGILSRRPVGVSFDDILAIQAVLSEYKERETISLESEKALMEVLWRIIEQAGTMRREDVK